MMKKILAALAAGFVALVFAPPAHAATTRHLGQSDVVSLSGVTSNGASGAADFSYGNDGLFLHVDNTDSYVVQRWGGVNVPLSTVDSVQFEWQGTQGRPGIKYDVDGDGDGTVDCVLQGEQGENFARVNNYSDSLPDSDQHGNPSYCETGVTLGGYPDSDTFADFSTKFGPKATVRNVGISASGVVQSGVLKSITVGGQQDIFYTPASTGTPVANEGQLITRKLAHSVTYSFTTTSGKVHWTVTLNGKTVKASFDQVPGSTGRVRYVNHSHKNKVFRVYKNGEKVSTVVVSPR